MKQNRCPCHCKISYVYNQQANEIARCHRHNKEKFWRGSYINIGRLRHQTFTNNSIELCNYPVLSWLIYHLTPESTSLTHHVLTRSLSITDRVVKMMEKYSEDLENKVAMKTHQLRSQQAGKSLSKYLPRLGI